MTYKLPQPLVEALIKAAKVSAFIVLSAVAPLIVAYLSNDVRWVALAPVVNVILASVLKYLETSRA